MAVLNWVFGGDSADNVMHAVSHLLNYRRGDRDTLTWTNRLDTLVYCLSNLGIPVHERFSATVALLNSGLDRDQLPMVLASIECNLGMSNILPAIR